MVDLDMYSYELETVFSFDFVDAIVLFGSYLDNSTTTLSDIDICVITRKPISTEQKLEILKYCDDILDISIFDELPLSAQYTVVRTGKVLFSKKDITTLKINTINEYRDFRPRLNRIYKSKGLLAIE